MQVCDNKDRSAVRRDPTHPVRPGNRRSSTITTSQEATHAQDPALDPEKVVQAVVESLDADKAEDVIVVDLRGRSTMADHLVIASGLSQRQVVAMSDHLYRKLKDIGLSASIEGAQQGDWVLIDGGDIIVHLFRPEVRAFYNLERMWGLKGPNAAGAQTA